jgi:ArsR family transcriptional regulator, arsenate/arsenite/antimonite-responsive transcriptional repressor
MSSALFDISNIVESSNLTWECKLETRQAITALGALAQELRLEVFRMLVRVGPAGMAASRIAEHLGIPPSSLSFHLKELAHAGLVTSRQEGRFVIYVANFSAMNALIGFLTESCCGGNPCTPVGKTACNTNPAEA